MHVEEPRSAAPERHITVAFDGVCKGNPGPGGYAAILVNAHTQTETVVHGREPETTNNRMELRAAIEALNALQPGAVVTMIGDSEYVLKGMTEWMRRNGCSAPRWPTCSTTRLQRTRALTCSG